MSDEQRKQLEEKIKNMSPEELREFQKQQCIFCQIIAGKIPAKKVFEDNKSIAILDINPAAKGHILIIPKEHYAIMPQVPEKEIGHLFLVSKYLSQILLKTLRAGGTTVFIANGLVAGQRAQHFMIHLIPRKEGDRLLECEEKLLDKAILQKIRTALENRFNELMGIQKEIVSAPEEKEEPVSPAPSPPPPPPPVTAPTPEPKPSRREEDDDVSLDDIASLFK